MKLGRGSSRLAFVSMAVTAAMLISLIHTGHASAAESHTVQPGETLSSIAARWGTSVSAVAQANGIQNPDLIYAGQVLVRPGGDSSYVPPPPPPAAQQTGGETYTVKPGDTLSSIAARWGTTVAALAAANGIQNPDRIHVGQVITRNTQSGYVPVVHPVAAAGYIWPASGPISQYFAASHQGIDIDLFSNPNAPIVASRAGTVTFVGGDACCSYGLYVVVNHGDGVETLYAHLSQFAVRQGQHVGQGDLLGYGGRTGRATGEHLHFEIKINGTPVNPLNHLP